MADPFAHKRDGSWSSKDGRRPWGDEEILEVLDLLENEGLSYSETGRRVGRSRSAVGGVYRQIKDAIDREDPDGFRDGTMPRYWWRRRSESGAPKTFSEPGGKSAGLGWKTVSSIQEQNGFAAPPLEKEERMSRLLNRTPDLVTSREVPEWRGKRPDSAIPPRVKVRIFDRQGGRCAECDRKLGVAGESVEYDHEIALVNGGEHAERNIRALCAFCHAPKTRKDVAIKKKTASVRKKHLGLSGPKRKMAYRKFDDTPVWPGRDD